MREGAIDTLVVLKRRFQQKRREGGMMHALKYMFKLFLGVSLTPLYYVTRGRRSFKSRGKDFRYFIHWYNATFDNERAFEIPLALYAVSIAGNGKVLEVGNVLSHYVKVNHDVLDKYEKGKNVIHEDIVTFDPAKKYDLIVSISTLEHVGFDEEEVDPDKILRAMKNLRSILAPGGRLLATIPVGFNPSLTPLLRNEELFDMQHYFVRVSASNRFEETTKEDALSRRFDAPYTFANGIVVGLIGPWPERF